MKYLLTVAIAATLSGCTSFYSVMSQTNKQFINISTQGLDENQRPYLKAAIDGWNTKLGFRQFNLIEINSDLNVSTTEKFWSSLPITTVGCYVYPVLYSNAQIIIKRDVPEKYLTGVFYHELGHSMGLKHYNTKESIMFPYINTSVQVPSDLDVQNALNSLKLK